MDISTWQKIWNKLNYGWDLAEIGTTLMVVPDFSHWSVHEDHIIDESKFEQQIIDKNVKAIIYKGTDYSRVTGQMFVDRAAVFWWNLAKKYKLLTGCYHWLQWAVDPRVAFKFHDEFIQQYPTDFPYIIDFEEPSVTNFSDYIWRLEVWTGLAKAKLINDDPVIYTGGWYLDIVRNKIGMSDYTKKMSKFAKYPAWFALYSRYFPDKYCKTMNKEVFYPWGSNDWVMWQYSDAADFPYYKDNDQYYGTSWGIPSSGLDMNLVKISWLQKYLDNQTVEQPETPEETNPEPNDNGIYYIAKNDMNVRNGAGTSYSKINTIKSGTRLKVLDIGGNDSWIKTEYGWVCKSLNGIEYLKKE